MFVGTFSKSVLSLASTRYCAIDTIVPTLPLLSTREAVLMLAPSCQTRNVFTSFLQYRWHAALRARHCAARDSLLRRPINFKPGSLRCKLTFAPGLRSYHRNNLQLGSIDTLHHCTVETTLDAHPQHVLGASHSHALNRVPPHGALGR